MSFTRIWVHIVFSTKNRKHFLTNQIRYKVIKHIRENCAKNDIHLKEINGYTDHLHCLVSLKREQTIAKVCQHIKGESSHWINEQKLTRTKFQWQDAYWAVSVGESQLPRVIAYIRNQERHHGVKTLEKELGEFKICEE